MSSIADYIAKNYLSADKKKKKKKVKKKANASTVIHDDDDTTFKNSIDESDEEEKEKKLSRSRSRMSRSRSRSKSRSQSPIQKRSHEYSDEEADKNNKNVKDKTVRMSDGSLAGLQAGKDLKLDAKRKQRAQRELLARMTSEESGKHAKTIYRDKYGKKVDLAVEKAKMAAEERKKEAEAEKDMVWGKGLVQQREREELVRKLRKEKDRSFAVYKDDKELNEEQMEKDRWGDPMAKLIKKKSKSKTIRPKYNGPPPPPNRFNIEPGYRWDGVDRSNGFEEKYFQMKNQKESVSEVAYKWSTEDM
ncbi:hypothetical protein BCR36DRAFT_356849 [Piromyces finnis]|uniref:Pre-mRNA-splicing factor CWC26 n=1 Tax=Piromyces finnis TaxID=1754191 RepID=A0A1Y1V4X8_9FUNG|nr:hypothetical protein BCR36DRAFT_356849 [Piromyces finnis]|eukprot:ORX46707.1 hypothetical protein BCR36DRAFT_356849 [Piromyces finnis]